MNSLFRNALTPLGLWGLMALLPLAVIALYFLKLKREPLEVPSTYLWNKSIEDLHVNSLWQRLRKSLLLLLQLLVLALIVLALLRPGWEGERLDGQKFIFLVDNSASMGAIDLGPGGESDQQQRLDEAKKQVAALIEQMESGMSAMVVSFADEARVVQEFTSNRRKLREQLDKIELSTRTTNLLGALQLADGLANPGQMIDEESNVEVEVTLDDERGDKTTLYIFSDGRFADVKGFSLGNLDPQIYVPMGKADTSNLAITAFSTRRNETGQGNWQREDQQAFVKVSNFSSESQTVVVELSHNDAFRDAREIEVPAGESRGATFTLTGDLSGHLTAKLSNESTQTAGDRLAIDNRAYAVMNASSAGRVLVVTPGNKVLSIVLSTERVNRLAKIEERELAFLKTKEYRELAEAGAYDLVVFDQCSPEKMPRSNTLFIGRIPPTAKWHPAPETTDPTGDSTESEESPEAESEAESESESEKSPAAFAEVPRVSRPQVIDYAREHPLLAYVELGDLSIEGCRLVKPPRGGTSLIDSTAGPIFSIAPREGFEDAVLGFELMVTSAEGQFLNTNWYRRHSFPTFILNMLDYFVSQDQEGVARIHLPGRPMELRLKSLAKQLTVAGPNGLKQTVKRTEEGTYLFHATETPGLYDVLEGEEVVGRFAVNLFDAQESNIAVAVQPNDASDDQTESAASLQIGHVEVSATGATPARKELWRLFLLLALGVLLLEWYIYNRRVYI